MNEESFILRLLGIDRAVKVNTVWSLVSYGKVGDVEIVPSVTGTYQQDYGKNIYEFAFVHSLKEGGWVKLKDTRTQTCGRWSCTSYIDGRCVGDLCSNRLPPCVPDCDKIHIHVKAGVMS